MMTAQKVYTLLGNESLWQVAQRCHALFDAAKLAHAICGGVAVCLHGYQRNTVDIDFIISGDNSEDAKRILEEEGYRWDAQAKEFISPSGVVVQFLMAEERAAKDSEVRIPVPRGEANVELIEGLSVVRLSRLIEMKLASGLGNLRRTHKDFADVVELIAIRKLDGSFARHLHSSLRETFRELVRRVHS